MFPIGCINAEQSSFCALEFWFIDTFFFIFFPISILFVFSFIGLIIYSFYFSLREKDIEMIILSSILGILIIPMLIFGLIWDFNLFMNNDFSM